MAMKHAVLTPSKVYEVKLVMLGDQGVGKTALVGQYMHKSFIPTSMTIGATFSTRITPVDGVRVKTQIWDTAGQERFRSMAALYYRQARAAVVVVDVTNAKSVESAHYWLRELKAESSTSEIVLGLAANKVDLGDDYDKKQLENICVLYGARLFLTSAKTGVGVEGMYTTLVRLAVQVLKEEESKAVTVADIMPERPDDSTSCC